MLDEPGVAEHPQVLAHRRAAYRQPLREPADRRGPLMQQFQDAAAHRLAERIKYRVRSLVTHKQRLL